LGEKELVGVLWGVWRKLTTKLGEKKFRACYQAGGEVVRNGNPLSQCFLSIGGVNLHRLLLQEGKPLHQDDCHGGDCSKIAERRKKGIVEIVSPTVR